MGIIESKAAKKPKCYCLPEQKYCGLCEICKRPGHVRPYPGAVPCTGSWCEDHYEMEKQKHENQTVGYWIQQFN